MNNQEPLSNKFAELLATAKSKGYNQKQVIALLGYKAENKFSAMKLGRIQPSRKLILNLERLIKSLK